MFLYHSRIAPSVLQFAENVDEFHPELDNAMWLSRMLECFNEDYLANLKQSLSSRRKPTITSDMTAVSPYRLPKAGVENRRLRARHT